MWLDEDIAISAAQGKTDSDKIRIHEIKGRLGYSLPLEEEDDVTRIQELEQENKTLRQEIDELKRQLLDTKNMMELYKHASPSEETTDQRGFESDPARAGLERPKPVHTPAPSGAKVEWLHLQNEEEIYQSIRERLLKDARVLQVMSETPRIEIMEEVKVIKADGHSLRGRVARLIHEGFLREPRNPNQVYLELKRLGAKVAKPGVYAEMDKLAEWGFLTKEEKGYMVVPSVNKRIELR